MLIMTELMKMRMRMMTKTQVSSSPSQAVC